MMTSIEFSIKDILNSMNFIKFCIDEVKYSEGYDCYFCYQYNEYTDENDLIYIVDRNDVYTVSYDSKGCYIGSIPKNIEI